MRTRTPICAVFPLLLLLMVFSVAIVACESGTSDGDDQSDASTTGEKDGTTSSDGRTAPEDITCTPLCDGKECGDDGCGGLCGHCYTMEGSLKDELCLEDQTCLACGCPEDQECGVDACGSPCGSCIYGWLCNDQNLCEPPPVHCDYSGFHHVVQSGKMNKNSDGGFDFHYQAMTEEEMPFSVVVLDWDTSVGGPAQPGTYDLAYESFVEGGMWLYVLQNWSGEGYEKLYVPTEGTIEVLEVDPRTGDLKAIVHSALLEEAIYNGDTNTPDWVAHGETWCLDTINLEATLAMTQPYCVEEGNGYQIGDNIADFQLQRCDGKWTSLHEACGNIKAMWFVATAGW
jgi:hypothetical protein